MKESKKDPSASPCYQFTFFSKPSLADPIRDKSKATDLDSFHYQAFYFGGEDLRVYPVARNKDFREVIVPFPGLQHPAIKKGMLLPIPTDNSLPRLIDGIKEPWEVFYTHCSFEHIIVPISSPFCVWGEKIGATSAEITRAIGDGQSKIISKLIRKKPPNYKAMLNLIRDKPDVLHNERVRERFIDILKDAQDYSHREESERLKALLKDHLIPKNPKGKKAFLSPAKCELAISLAKRLAGYLSKKCKDALENQGFNEKEDLRLDNIEAYEALKKWALETHEYRISYLPQKTLPPFYDLQTLILQPSMFVEKIIKKELRTTIKTLTNKR